MSAGLEAALAQLETMARRRERPSHYLARHLLLELGQELAQGTADEAVRRARSAGEALAQDWSSAVETELSLACGEFAQSVDPRYLALPSYDLEYTQAARAKLHDRLRAAAELGFALAPREEEVLALAERVFVAFLEQRKGAAPVPEAPPAGPHKGPGVAKTPSRQDRP